MQSLIDRWYNSTYLPKAPEECTPDSTHVKQIEQDILSEAKRREAFIKENSWLQSQGFPLSKDQKVSFSELSKLCLPSNSWLSIEETLSFFDQFLKEWGKNDARGSILQCKRLLERWNNFKKEVGKFPANQRKERLEAYARDLTHDKKITDKGWMPILLGNKLFILKFNREKKEVSLINGQRMALEGDRLLTQSIEKESGELKERAQYATCTTIKGIDEKQFSNPQFFKSLLEVQLQQGGKKSEHYLYNGILSILGGKRVELKETESDSLTKSNSQLGSPFKTLSQSLFHEVGKEEYRRLKFYWQWQALLNHFRSSSEQMKKRGISALQAQVYENILRNLARATEKFPLNEKERNAVQATIWDIESRMEGYKAIDAKEPKPLLANRVSAMAHGSNPSIHIPKPPVNTQQKENWAVRTVKWIGSAVFREPLQSTACLIARTLFASSRALRKVHNYFGIHTGLSANAVDEELSQAASSEIKTLNDLKGTLKKTHFATFNASRAIIASAFPKDKVRLPEWLYNDKPLSSFAAVNCLAFSGFIGSMASLPITQAFYGPSYVRTILDQLFVMGKHALTHTGWLGKELLVGTEDIIAFIGRWIPFNDLHDQNYRVSSLLGITKMSVLEESRQIDYAMFDEIGELSSFHRLDETLSRQIPQNPFPFNLYLSMHNESPGEYYPVILARDFCAFVCSCVLYGIYTKFKGTLSEWVSDTFNHQELAYAQRQIAAGVLDLFQTLPMPKRGERDLWDEIPEKEIESTMQTIEELSLALSFHSQTNDVDPKLLTAMNGFLAIQDKLARRLPSTKLGNAETNFTEFREAIKNPQFLVENPSMQKQLAALCRYVDKTIDLDTHRPEITENKSNSKERGKKLFGLPFESLELNEKALKEDPTFGYFKQFLDLSNPKIIQRLEECGLTSASPTHLQITALMADQFPADRAPIDFLNMSEEELKKRPKYHSTLDYVTKSDDLNAVYERFGVDSSAPGYKKVACCYQWWDQWAASQDLNLKTLSPCLPKAVTLLRNSAMRASYYARSGDGMRSGLITPRLEVERDNADKIKGYSFHPYGKGARLEADIAFKKYTEDSLFKEDNKTQNKIIAESKGFKNLSIEERRALQMIGVDPYDEANRAVSFMKNYPETLEDKDVQDKLYSHIFKTERLQNQLKDNPQYGAEMGNRLQEVLNHFIEVKNPQMALKAAEWGYKLGKFVKTDYPDFRQEIYSKILPAIQKKREGGQHLLDHAFDALVLLHADETAGTLSMQEIAEDLLVWCTHKNSGNSVSHSPREVYQTRFRFCDQYFDYVSKNREACNKICNRLLELNFPGVKPGTWRGLFPNLHSGLYTVNLLDGSISKVFGKTYTQLPQKVYEDPHFSRLCVGDIDAVEKVSDNQYLIHPQELQVTLSPYNEVYYSREIAGKHYDYVNEDDSLKYQLPAFIETDARCWAHKGAKPHIYIQNPGKAPLFVTLKDLRDGTWTTQATIDTVVEKRGEGLFEEEYLHVPYEELHHSLKFLGTLERDSRYINSWRKLHDDSKKDEDILELNLTRMKLHFKGKIRKGRNQLECSSHPGYFLKEPCNLPLFDESVPKLILENNQGDKRVLFPGRELQTRLGGSQTKPAIEVNPANEREDISDWHAFDLTKEGYEAHSLDGNLYLAYLHLLHGDIAKASGILNKIQPLDRFTEEQKQIFSWIKKELKSRPQPAGPSLLAKIAIYDWENRQKYPLAIGQEEGELFTFKELFLLINQKGFQDANAASCDLSQEEELKFFTLVRQRGESNGKDLYTFKDQVAHKAKMNALRQLIENREAYLKSGKAVLMSRTIQVIKPEDFKGEEVIAVDDLENLFENFTIWPVSSETCKRYLRLDDQLFDIPETSFILGFFAYYKVILEGTEDEREQILSRLRFHKNLVSPKAKAYIDRLIAVCENRENFPKIDQIKNRRQKINQMRRDVARCNDPKAKKELQKSLDSVEKEDKKWVSSLAGTSFMFKVRQIFLKALHFLKLFYHYLQIQFQFPDLTPIFKPKYLKPAEKTTDAPLFFGESALNSSEEAMEKDFTSLAARYFDEKTIPLRQGEANLPTSHDNPMVEQKLHEEQEALDEYRNLLKPVQEYSVRRRPALWRKGALSELKSLLNERIDTWDKSLSAQKQELIKRANLHENNTLRFFGSHHQVDFETLFELFVKGDFDTYRKKTKLTPEEIEKLYNATGAFLLKSTRLQQMQRAASLIREIEELQKEPGNEEKCKLLVQDLANNLKAKRNYKLDPKDLHEFPIQRLMLAHEYANRYFYRKEQVDKIREILQNIKDHPENLAKMPTGYGKTKTICPTLNEILLQGGQHVLNIWPAELEITNTLDAQKQMKDSFGRAIDRMRFDRTTNFNANSLSYLYNLLLKEKKEGIPLNMKAESVRSLELHLLATLHKLKTQKGQLSSDQVRELREQVKYLIKIQIFLGTVTWATIDEAHRALHPKDKLIYTNGKGVNLPDSQIGLIECLFREMLKEPIHSILELTTDKERYFSDEQWNEIIKPKLAEASAQYLQIEAGHKQLFLDYVLGKTEHLSPLFSEPSQRKLICLAKGELVQVMKSCLHANVDENFGFSHLHFDKKEYAISYRGHKTPKETALSPSQFKNPHETFNKTYIAYLRKGLTLNQVHKLFAHLKNSAALEGKPLGTTEADKFYAALFNGNPPKLLGHLTQHDVERIGAKLCRNREAIFYYVRHVVAKQYKLYPEIFISSTQNFRAQLAASLSLTATPPPTAALGPSTNFIPMKGSSGRITHLLLTKNADPSTIHIGRSSHPQGTMHEAQRILAGNPRMRATIDIGALLKGMTNLQAAKKIGEELKGDGKTEAVLFFDEKSGRFKIYNIASGSVQDFEGCDLKPENRVSIYDQNRCFGSDIKQDPYAVALTLLGKRNTKDIADQGNGRMRGLPRNQSIEWLIQQPLAKEIFKSGKPNVMELLTFLIANQAQEEAENNFDAQTQQMDNEIRRACLLKIYGMDITKSAKENAKLIEKEVDVDSALAYYSQFEKEFVGGETADPELMYAHLTDELSARHCLEDKYHSCRSHLNTLSGLSDREKEFVHQHLSRYPAGWEKMLLPASRRKNNAELEMECEVMEEQEVEQNVEAEAQRYDQLTERTAWSWNPKTDLFSPGWEEPTEITRFLFVKRLANRITHAAEDVARSVKRTASKPLGFGAALISDLDAKVAKLPARAAKAVRIAAKALKYISLAFAGIFSAIYFPALTFAAANFFLATAAIPHLEKFSKELLGVNCPLYTAQEILSYHLPRKAVGAAPFFSSNLLISNNYFTHKPASVLESGQRLFDEEQKPLYNVVVIQDTTESGKKKLQMMLIDQNDSQFFRKQLREDNKRVVPADRTRKVAVYDPENGLLAEGGNRFEPAELQTEEFKELLVQAKLLNSKVHFSNEELEIIERRARKTGVALNQLDQLMLEEVLSSHPLEKKWYPQTTLSKRLKGAA